MRAYELIREHGRLTFRDVQDEMGVGYTHANNICRSLHDIGATRIVAYQRNTRGEMTPIYVVADGQPDAKKPKRISSAEACRRYRARLRKEGGTSETPAWTSAAYNLIVKQAASPDRRTP